MIGVGVIWENGIERILGMARGLFGRSGRVGVWSGVSGHDALAAMGTRIMLLQPSAGAFAVEPVFAGENGNGVTYLYGVHADRAFGFAIGAEHAFVDLFLRQSGNGGGRSRSGRVRSVILIHHLPDDAVEGFLGIDCVAVNSIGWVMVASEELSEEEAKGTCLS